MEQPKLIRQLGSQILSPPSGSGVILELLDDNESAFMEVNIDPAGQRNAVIYPTDAPISLPLHQLMKVLWSAESQVRNVDPDSLFDDKSAN